MVDFNALLQNTLSSINKAFKEAENDLSQIAENINSAVKENAGPEFAFKMFEARNDVNGVVYRFYFDTDVNDERADAITICFINVPSAGYPLHIGEYSYKDKVFKSRGLIYNKEDLMKFFGEFLEQPESPLIQAIGFALRKKKNDEIPY